MDSAELPSLTCRIAGLDCVVEPGNLSVDTLHRFDPFIIPEWSMMNRHPVRSGVSESIVRLLARRHPGWSGSQLAMGSLCRTMLNGFAQRGVLAIGGACIMYHDRAYLFSSGSSGEADRHALLWRQYLGDDVRLLGNGWVVVAETREGRDCYAVASNTPWWIGYNPGDSITCPLEGWCFVRPDSPGERNAVERMDPAQMVDDAMQSMFVPTASLDAARALETLDRLMILTPLYRGHLGDGETAVAESFQAMTGESFDDARSPFPLPPLSGAHAWD